MLHSLHQFLRSTLDVDARTLQHQQVLVGRQSQSSFVAFGRQGLSRRDVADDMAFDTIFLTEQFGNAVADGDHLVQLGHHEAFDAFPHTLYLGPMDQFGRLSEIFVAIKHHLDAFQPRYEVIGQDGIQVVGQEQLCAMKQHKEKQA